jgi:hypothetical protein
MKRGGEGSRPPGHVHSATASRGVPAERSGEAVDDALGVEVLPAGLWRRLGESPFGFNELVHEVAAGRDAAEHLGELGVFNEPVRVERGPVLIRAVSDAVHDVMDLAGLVQQVAYPLSSLVDARTLWVQPRDPSRAMSQESVETLARLNEVFNRGDVDGAMDGVIARAHWHGRGKVSGASIDRRQFDLRSERPWVHVCDAAGQMSTVARAERES